MTRRPHLVARLSLAAAMSTVAVIAVAPWANADAPVTLGLATPVTYDPAITGPITNASVDAVSCPATAPAWGPSRHRRHRTHRSR